MPIQLNNASIQPTELPVTTIAGKSYIKPILGGGMAATIPTYIGSNYLGSYNGYSKIPGLAVRPTTGLLSKPSSISDNDKLLYSLATLLTMGAIPVTASLVDRPKRRQLQYT